MIHMEYYLVVSTIMMFAGIYGFFTRRNTLAILISVELMLNATDINFPVFNRFLFPGGMEGYFFALFSIAISADVDVEIRPASHDDRVIVGHRAMGDTVVNYRPDGLTVEVFPKESIDPVHSIAIECADLYEEEVFG